MKTAPGFNIPYLPGETTLWEGRPDTSFRYGPLHLFYGMLGTFMLIMLSLGLFVDLNGTPGLVAAWLLFCFLYVLAHALYFLLGVPYVDMLHRQQTFYRLTDRRAIILDASPLMGAYTYDLNRSLRVDHDLKFGSVYLTDKRRGATRIPMETGRRLSALSRYWFFFTKLLNSSGFRFIDGADQVAAMARKAASENGKRA
ncbi:hypothetical protein AADZ90_001745 [Aestuariibius sp. 2305UL40-4]|uniref:hypothetical protein n=1 Tax=Aestuariibius violaceus TaxID=3234132 RepID=UPI00345E35D3